MTAAATPILPRNPHFDDQRVIWSDAFSGAYESVAYDEQFDDQWRLFLERKTGFCDHTGVETSDEYIDDRIAELTGVRDVLYRRKWGVLATLMAKLSGRSASVDAFGSNRNFHSHTLKESAVSMQVVARAVGRKL